MTVLTLTAGLAGILRIGICGLRDRLTVGNLRLTDIGLNLELAKHTVDNDLQMKLTHTGDDCLARLLIGVGLEGRILLRKLLKGDAHLLLTGLCLRLDRNTDNGLRELHGLKDDRMFSSQSVSPVVVFFRPMAASISPA